VNRDRVFEFQSVAAGECDHHGDALGLGDLEHESISLLQSRNRQRQSAELIFAIRIGSGEVADEFRLELLNPKLSASPRHARYSPSPISSGKFKSSDEGGLNTG